MPDNDTKHWVNRLGDHWLYKTITLILIISIVAGGLTLMEPPTQDTDTIEGATDKASTGYALLLAVGVTSVTAVGWFDGSKKKIGFTLSIVSYGVYVMAISV